MSSHLIQALINGVYRGGLHTDNGKENGNYYSILGCFSITMLALRAPEMYGDPRQIQGLPLDGFTGNHVRNTCLQSSIRADSICWHFEKDARHVEIEPQHMASKYSKNTTSIEDQIAVRNSSSCALQADSAGHRPRTV